MKKREIGNMVLHLGIGGALTALVLWNRWFLIPTTFIWAWLREQAQHRYILTEIFGPGPAVYSVDKRTFFDFGWLNGHRLWEVFQWVIGAAIALGIYEVL